MESGGIEELVQQAVARAVADVHAKLRNGDRQRSDKEYGLKGGGRREQRPEPPRIETRTCFNRAAADTRRRPQDRLEARHAADVQGAVSAGA